MPFLFKKKRKKKPKPISIPISVPGVKSAFPCSNCSLRNNLASSTRSVRSKFNFKSPVKSTKSSKKRFTKRLSTEAKTNNSLLRLKKGE